MKQRILTALVALISLVSFHTRPLDAQPVPPTTDTTSEAESADSTEPLVLKSGEKVSSLVVRDKPLIIEGEVTHDVVAFNSDVVIKHGATVGGNVIIVNGSVKNDGAENIKLVVSNDEGQQKTSEVKVPLPPAAHSKTVERREAPLPTPAIATPQRIVVQKVTKPNDWSGNQIALFLFGLIGAVALLLVAPRATEQATDILSFEPGRCLVVGGLGVIGLLAASLINSMVTKSPLGLFWSPLGTLVGVVTLVILGFGWLCGMRFVGDIVARKFGRYEEGKMFPRIALGLFVFCLAKLVLNGISHWFGGATLLLEAGFAIMGLGGLLVSGFGTNPDWLGARLRGENRWMSR